MYMRIGQSSTRPEARGLGGFCQDDKDSLRKGSQSGVPRVGSSKTIMVAHDDHDVPVVCFMIFLDDHDVPVVCFMIILDDHDVGGGPEKRIWSQIAKMLLKINF